VSPSARVSPSEECKLHGAGPFLLREWHKELPAMSSALRTRGCLLGAGPDSFLLPNAQVPLAGTILCSYNSSCSVQAGETRLTYMVLIGLSISCLQTCPHMNFNFLLEVIYRKCYKVPPNLVPKNIFRNCSLKKRQKTSLSSGGTPAGLLSCSCAGFPAPRMPCSSRQQNCSE